MTAAHGMAPPRAWFRRPPPDTLLDQLAGLSGGLAAILFEHAAVGLLGIDRLGGIVRANAAMRALAGPEADFTAGRAAAALFAESARASAAAAFASCLGEHPALSGHAARPMFVTVLRCGAAVGMRLIPLRQARGPVCGALLQMTDLSGQRRLEDQLAQAQKMQVIGQFTGGIAHDFNNVLTAILGAADGVAAHGERLAHAADDLAEIRASAGRGAALVRQLLAFGRPRPEPAEVLDLNDVVSGVFEMLRRLLGSRIRLDLALTNPGGRVRAEPTQLEQVLVNLAVNARDAMPEGGRLTVRTGPPTVDCRTPPAPATRYVTVEVEDSGVGIAPEILPRIFDPFFTTRQEHGGTGLGLSTVQQIVHRWGGVLDVRSAPGEGTRMRVCLPATDEPASAPAEPIRPGAAPGGAALAPGTVLVVDDEEPVRKLAERALARAGWSVIAVASGEHALAELAGHHGPLAGLVADLAMPGMDGLQLLQAVRALDGLAAVPALLVSGYAEASLQRAMAEQSRAAFLAKPYSPGELVASFAALLAAAGGRPEPDTAKTEQSDF